MVLPSCMHCVDCQDKLKAIYVNTKYRNNDIVVFINDEGIEKKDTVSLGYSPVPDHFCYGIMGSEPIWNSECFGTLKVKLRNYEIKYYTHYPNDVVGCYLYFFSLNLADRRYTSEVSDYNYNGTIGKTKHFMMTDTVKINMKVYCTDCRITTPDNKLFSFSIYNQGTIENWRLK